MKEDWTESILENFISYNGVFSDGDWVEKKDQDVNGEVRLIQLADIGDGNFRDKSNKKLTIDRARKMNCLFLNYGDILIARMPEPLGRATIFPLDKKESYITAVDVAVLRPNACSINSKYLLHLINSPSIRSEIDKLKSGTTRKRISRKNLNKILFPLAPLPEQQAIVKKIEGLLSSLDHSVESLTKAQEQLKIYRQAVLKKAFEGELTKEWREKKTDLPTADELLVQIQEEREKHYEKQIDDWKNAIKVWEEKGKESEKPKKPSKPTNLDFKIKILDDIASLFKTPKSWNIQHLAFISDNRPNSIVDGPFGSSINVAEDYKKEGVPVIRMVNIRPLKYISKNLRYIVKEKFRKLIRHNILSGDVLIAKVGATIGDCCIYPDKEPEGMLSTTGSCRIRLDSNVYLPKMLQYYIYFQKYKLKNIASQTAQPFLNMKVLKSYPIPFLTIKEQHQIVKEIESRLSVCDKLEESIVTSLQKAKALRQSILKKAFEGTLLTPQEIAACKADPNYEPASVLLEKIKAEKAAKEAPKKTTVKKKPKKRVAKH
ncbi:type I restriction enzyme, S subunit [Tenacibaculum sp. MAR_2009_124]|uniref:restriction endonuclease subunit S n=1 Tax=Tenacibaculum sp. MAR_2009_124 TaxID=1250059 RepID=UPI00089C8907|nr:restriction endonuclease subunit S [Tenacibaculum sp. MAR_2009_124]SEC29106.1 type I restriction enzyme, S subunit [Tenacibaculum sp. MAR_2009_124]